MTYIKNTYITNAPVPIAKYTFPIAPAGAPHGAQTVYLAYHGGFLAGYETSAQVYMPKCRVKKMNINVTANTLGTASTITLRKNATSTAITGTVGAGATGQFTFSGDVSFSEGDLLSVMAELGGTTAQNITFRGGVVVVEVETW